MTKIQREALERVVDYLWEDEARNFKEMNKPQNHIFRDLKILDNLIGRP